MPFLFIDGSFIKPPNEQLWAQTGIARTTDIPIVGISDKNKPPSTFKSEKTRGISDSEELVIENGSVAEIMTRKLTILDESTSQLRDALRLFATHSFRHLPVMSSDNQLVGIVSDRDILKTINRSSLLKGDYFSTPIKSVMITTVLTATEDTDVSEVATLMAQKNIGSLPIVRESKEENIARLVGIVTITDLYKLLIPGQS